MTRTPAPPSSGLEVELKFELTRDLVRMLARAAPFKALWSEPARKKSLRATYFDTPDLKLSGRALSLRVRKESRQFVQCFKAIPDVARATSTDGFARLEWEWLLPGPALNAQLLSQDAEVKALLKGVSMRQLQPLFTTNIKRQTRLLTTPGGATVRYDLDQGRILAGDRETPIFELELELQSGPVSELLELARVLTSVVPTRLSSRTKAQRGQELALGAGDGWVKAQPLLLTHDAQAHDVLCASVVEGLKHLIANEDCVLERRHIEGVHQMRVALRRMRAVITTYKNMLPKGCFENLSRDLKAAGTVMSPARDWDVFLDEILSDVESGIDPQPALHVLRKKAQSRRDKAYDQVMQMIRSADYARLLTDALYWVGTQPWVTAQHNPLEIPAVKTAEAVLARHHKRVLKVGQGLRTMSTDQRHQLRIAIKKARYAAEFFAVLYPRNRAAPYLRRLRALQNGLGHLNDLATAQRLMAELATGTRGKNAHALNRAAGLVEGWYTHADHIREDALLKAWAAFARGKVFW